MKMVAPRWFAVALLPLLAAALHFVNFELLYAPLRLAKARNFDGTSSIVLLLGYLVGPLLAALVFAYPLGRVYAGRAVVAGLAIALPTVTWALHGRLNDPLGSLLLVVTYGWLAVAVPVVAMLAGRALAGSRLAVASADPSPDAGATNAHPLPGADPRALQWIGLPLLAIGFFILRDLLQPVVWDIAIMADTPWIERAALMAGAVTGPALLALMLAYPIARLYERRAALAGALVAAPTAWYWAAAYLGEGHSRFWNIGYTLHVVAMLVLAVASAWWLQRRLAGSRLRVVAVDSTATG